jgi:hypothetical protein
MNMVAVFSISADGGGDPPGGLHQHWLPEQGGILLQVQSLCNIIQILK